MGIDPVREIKEYTDTLMKKHMLGNDMARRVAESLSDDHINTLYHVLVN